MHDRKRTAEPTEAEKRKTLEKIAKYNRLKEAILNKNSNKLYDQVGDQISASLIGVNPDFYTLFDYRKDLLNSYFAQGKDKKQLCEAELQIIQAGLTKNSKSYGAWHHRKWVIGQATSDLSNELALCSRLLDLDSRNFHCWNYRQFIAIAQIGNSCLEDEFAYTTGKISQDPSNYSAWHYRSVLIRRLAHLNNQDTLEKELALVHKAVGTDPYDQSAWLYQQWLLGGIARNCSNCAELYGKSRFQVSPEVLSQELQVCENLLQVDPNCKWVLLTQALLYTALGQRDKLPPLFEALQAGDELKRPQYYSDLQLKLSLDQTPPEGYCGLDSCCEQAAFTCVSCKATKCSTHF